MQKFFRRSVTQPQRLFVLALGLACEFFTPQVLAVDNFFEDFQSGVLNPQLQVVSNPGFSLSFSGGRALLDQTAGDSNGQVFLTSRFQGTGNFTTTVAADRIGLSSAELGLWVDYGTDRADVFFVNSDRINSNISVAGSGQATGSAGISSPQVTFRLRRVGATIFADYDSGAGFVTLNSRTDNSFTAPVTFSLFLVQEFGSTAPNFGFFDNWSISADTISAVPEPVTSILLLAGLGIVAVSRYKLKTGPTDCVDA